MMDNNDDDDDDKDDDGAWVYYTIPSAQVS